jgi:hypothetical protein
MKSMQWAEDILLRGVVCEICEDRLATAPHHCAMHRSKGYEKYLDVREDIEFVCDPCHKYPADTTEHKKEFWWRRVNQGYNMDKWWDGLPWRLRIGRCKPK